MSDAVLRDLVVRMATDPEFADRVRTDPGAVAAEHGVTLEQVAAMAQLGDGEGAAGPSMLDARLSKSSLFFGGGMHVDPHGFDPPAPIEPTHGYTGPSPFEPHDGAAFACDGAHPASAAFGTAHADPTAFLCDGFHPAGMGDGSVHPAAIQDDSVHPAGWDGDGHASQAVVAGAGIPPSAAPISLLTGKLVAPVDSHGAGIGASADSHAAGPGGGPVSPGIVGPDKAHGIIGPDHQHGIVGPDKPQIVGPDVPAAAEPSLDVEHAKPTLYVQATAPTIEPHAVQCNG